MAQLFALVLPEGAVLKVVILDDGSTDGTATAIASEYPDAVQLQGDGSFFWCGGMRQAWLHAAMDNPDFYFLLNDDTVLEPNVIVSLIGVVASADSRVIAVAAIRDAATGSRTYGGIRGYSSGVPMNGYQEMCDTFNANAVMIPRAVFRELGVFHEVYTHAMGDFDYGYEASRRGIKIIQSAEWLGTCSHNPLQGGWKDRKLSRWERFQKLQSPKGLPWKEWVIYNRRNAGWIWPYRCISPFLRILLGR